VTVAENVAKAPDAGEPAPRSTVRTYVDSTEVQPPSAASAKLGRIGEPRLLAAVRQVGFQLCVADLVVEEVAHRRLRYLKKVHGRLLAAAREVETYIPTTVEKTLDSDGLLETFRTEIRRQLEELGVEVIPTSTVSVPEVLALSLRREPPFAGKGEDEHDPTGFHDA
jgi:hypothetical protein